MSDNAECLVTFSYDGGSDDKPRVVQVDLFNDTYLGGVDLTRAAYRRFLRSKISDLVVLRGELPTPATQTELKKAYTLGYRRAAFRSSLGWSTALHKEALRLGLNDVGQEWLWKGGVRGL